tara:strand:- start:2299 stop:2712 length:414 start_codon:yes stop_codon:yes gene_type:complete
MIKTQQVSDKLAMSLSMICVVHCFFVPSFIVLSAGYLSFAVDNEFVHKLIVLLAIPISIFALSIGYRNHKTSSFIPMAIFGLALLVLAVVLGESVLGEAGERMLTLFGSVSLAFAHYKNYKTCKELDCSCHDDVKIS